MLAFEKTGEKSRATLPKVFTQGEERLYLEPSVPEEDFRVVQAKSPMIPKV